MSKVTIDDSRHPLILMAWPRDYTTADVEEFVAQMKILVRQKRRIAVIESRPWSRPLVRS